jgi:hypothetical protein
MDNTTVSVIDSPGTVGLLHICDAVLNRMSRYGSVWVVVSFF